MLLIQNKRVNWDTCQIGIPGATAKDKENRRIPFNPKGRLAAILKRRATLGPDAYRLREHERRVPADDSDGVGNAEAARQRHRAEAGEEGSGMEPAAAATHRSAMARPAGTKAPAGCCADGVDIRIIQLMLGHASIQQTQRYLNVTDEELRRGLEVSWRNQGRPLRLASGQLSRCSMALPDCPEFVPAVETCEKWLLRLDSNQQPSG